MPETASKRNFLRMRIARGRATTAGKPCTAAAELVARSRRLHALLTFCGQKTTRCRRRPTSIGFLPIRTGPPLSMPRLGSYSPRHPTMSAPADLDEAARELLIRYGASKWEMAHGTTALSEARLALDGQILRAIPNSGAAAAAGNGHAMEMLNWVNPGATPGSGVLAPVMRRINGRVCADHSARNTWGFWCKKSGPFDAVQPLARNRLPYHLHDPHFALVALSVPGTGHSGVAFQASKAEEDHATELTLSNNRPQARWTDSKGQRIVLTSPQTLVPYAPAVVTLRAEPGLQSLRVNGAETGRAEASFAPSNFAQLLIGWGFRSYFPNEGFGGYVYGVITGRGAPTDEELTILERYLGGTAGLLL